MSSGYIYIFPTDTVYGMGVLLEDNIMYKKIFEIKKRDTTKQLPILIYDIISINQIAKYTNRDLMIMKKFWPGALTVILNSTENFYKKTGFKTIALRIPDCEITQDILKEYGPMWTTSVNDSGEKEINDIEIIKKKYSEKHFKIFEEKIDKQDIKPSTVIDLCGNEVKILRQGIITKEEILKAIEGI